MIKSTYICHLGNPDIQKNSTCWFYCQIVCYLRKKLSRDLGSPGSHQLLQLQLFSQILLKFWTLLLIFILPKIVWIARLYFFSSLCYKLGLFEVEVRSVAFILFRKLLPVCKRINGGVLKMMSFWFERFPSSLSEVCLHSSQSLFLFAVTISEVK